MTYNSVIALGYNVVVIVIVSLKVYNAQECEVARTVQLVQRL